MGGVFLAVVLCFLIADFITGFFHWIEDTYGTVSDSWLSKYFWQPNIWHHKNPSEITQNSIWWRNWIQWAGASVLLISIYFLLPALFCWQLCFVLVLISFGNEFHNWSHRKTNHWLITMLQDMGIIQSKSHHAKHHLQPYSTRYCVLSNFLNPVLEKIHFWESLEAILSPIITPKRGMPEREGY